MGGENKPDIKMKEGRRGEGERKAWEMIQNG